MKALGEDFRRDIANHRMEVFHKDGLYRHIRFYNPASFAYWFDLITWPDCLTINGDMGTWTFSREKDMFTFFRRANGGINPHYWSEKLQHGVHGGRDSSKVWSIEALRSQLMEGLVDYDLSEQDLKLVKEAIEGEILNCEGEYEAMTALRDFSCELRFDGPNEPRKFTFSDDEYPDGKDYCYHFLWCCHAIVWGIAQWDTMVELEVS